MLFPVVASSPVHYKLRIPTIYQVALNDARKAVLYYRNEG